MPRTTPGLIQRRRRVHPPKRGERAKVGLTHSTAVEGIAPGLTGRVGHDFVERRVLPVVLEAGLLVVVLRPTGRGGPVAAILLHHDVGQQQIAVHETARLRQHHVARRGVARLAAADVRDPRPSGLDHRHRDRLPVLERRRAVVGHHHVERVRPRTLGSRRRPGEDTRHRVDRRSRRPTGKRKRQRVRRQVHVARTRREGQQGLLVHRLVADRRQHRSRVDFVHRHRDRLPVLERRSAVVGHHHVEHVVGGTLGLARRPGEDTRHRIDRRSRRPTGKRKRQRVRGEVGVARARREGQQGLFVHRLVADRRQHRSGVDFLHRHRDRLPVLERRRAVVGHHHVEHEDPGTLRLARYPGEDTRRRADRRSRRRTGKRKRQRVRREVRVDCARRERQQRFLVHRPVPDGGQHGRRVDLANRHGDRLAVLERRRAVVGHHHVELKHTRTLRLARRPGKHAAGSDAGSRRLAVETETQHLGRAVRITRGRREGQQRLFGDRLIADRVQHRRLVGKRVVARLVVLHHLGGGESAAIDRGQAKLAEPFSLGVGAGRAEFVAEPEVVGEIPIGEVPDDARGVHFDAIDVELRHSSRVAG